MRLTSDTPHTVRRCDYACREPGVTPRISFPQGMTGAIRKAEQIRARMPGAYMLQQFESAANPEIHYKTTGPEMWRDTAGTIDILVCGEVRNGSLPSALRSYTGSVTHVMVSSEARHGTALSIASRSQLAQ